MSTLTTSSPTWCGELELAARPDLPERVVAPDGTPFAQARVLVRLHGDPVGFVTVATPGGALDAAEVLNAVERELDPLPAPSGIPAPGGGVEVSVSVIVCTRDRGAALRSCLDSLRLLPDPVVEVIVVDNAPSDDTTQRVVAEASAADPRLRYVREPRPGLSRARNHGLAEARGDVVAYTDDDVRVDAGWVDGLLRGFARREDVACVTGLVASASLTHPAEQWFDARVWWSSTCEPRLFDARSTAGRSPLHPYAAGAFGTGANVAFRTDVLRRLGGFDERLGAGSPTGGGEDLDAFVRVLLSGRALSYEPAALVWHEHRSDDDALRRQMRAYGKGLSAYLTKYLLSPRTAFDVARRVPHGLRHAVRLKRRSDDAGTRSGASRGLLVAEIRGLLEGPLAYWRARRGLSRDHLRAVRP